MQADYPAAHSMDTCFFAIDRDGHVACFDTGEAGAVPVQALSGDSAYSVRRQLAQLPRVEVMHDRQGGVTPGRSNEFSKHGGRMALPDPTLVFLASLDPVREEIAAGRAVEVTATDGVAVLFRQVSESLAAQLHVNGACLGCCLYFQGEDASEGPLDLTVRGLFSYSHLTDNWILRSLWPRPPSRPADPRRSAAAKDSRSRQVHALRFAQLRPDAAHPAGRAYGLRLVGVRLPGCHGHPRPAHPWQRSGVRRRLRRTRRPRRERGG